MLNKKIVTICGSMKFLNQMIEWKEKLETVGYKVHIPTPTDFHVVKDEGNLEKFNEIKRRETKNHFEKVKEVLLKTIDHYRKIAKPSAPEELICFTCDFFRV